MSLEIADRDKYLRAMKNTFIDKAFFIEKLPDYIDTIIDYGCADGSFLNFLNQLYGDTYKYIGVEKNHVFKDMAKEKYDIPVYSDLESAYKHITNTKYVCINFSSVLHEALNEDKDLLIDIIQTYTPEVISIRDMLIRDDFVKTHFDENSETAHQFTIDCLNMFSYIVPEKLCGFVYKYPIKTTKQCIHFLLKYMYTENWGKECHENYLACNDLINTHLNNTIEDCGYKTIWKHFYLLPYLLRKWKNDGILTSHAYTYIENYVTTHFQYMLSLERS